jgi:hypothetical protein
MAPYAASTTPPRSNKPSKGPTASAPVWRPRSLRSKTLFQYDVSVQDPVASVIRHQHHIGLDVAVSRIERRPLAVQVPGPAVDERQDALARGERLIPIDDHEVSGRADEHVPGVEVGVADGSLAGPCARLSGEDAVASMMRVTSS